MSDHNSPSTNGEAHSASYSRDPARDYLAARHALINGPKQSGQMRAKLGLTRNSLDQFHKSFEQAFVEPLLREAATSPNPMKGALLLAAAEIIEQLHKSSALVTDGMKGGTAGRALPRPLVCRQKEERAKLIDRLIAIQREMTRKQ